MGSKVLIGIFVAGLMATSIMGFMATQGDNSAFVYNGQKFAQGEIGYVTQIGGKTISTFNLPDAVEDIELPRNIQDILESKSVFTITYDPNDIYSETLAVIQYNLENMMYPVFEKFAQRALTNTTDFPSMLEADCKDATAAIPVLKFMESNDTRFVLEGNCIIAEGDAAFNLQQVHDRLIFGLTGIIE